MLKSLFNKVGGNQIFRMATFSTTTVKSSPKLQGKVAVVTASTDGIGYAIAERLAADGANVVVSSRKENNVTNAVEKLKAQGFSVSGVVCHVAKAADRERLFKEAIDKFGGIDILISNAAVNPSVGPVLESPEDVWDKVFEVNVKAAYLLSKEVLPHLRKRKGGSIVLAQPKEMAGVVSFLVSDDASYVTGETIVAAGGMLSRL
ncbi:Dehydrogenase/reductase SDR family member 4 [Blattella germanica]|nr:Dehydrogenase/reductase SDR family member 4 [Blattella germanica]